MDEKFPIYIQNRIRVFLFHREWITLCEELDITTKLINEMLVEFEFKFYMETKTEVTTVLRRDYKLENSWENLLISEGYLTSTYLFTKLRKIFNVNFYDFISTNKHIYTNEKNKKDE